MIMAGRQTSRRVTGSSSVSDGQQFGRRLTSGVDPRGNDLSALLFNPIAAARVQSMFAIRAIHRPTPLSLRWNPSPCGYAIVGSPDCRPRRLRHGCVSASIISVSAEIPRLELAAVPSQRALGLRCCPLPWGEEGPVIGAATTKRGRGSLRKTHFCAEAPSAHHPCRTTVMPSPTGGGQKSQLPRAHT